MFRRSIAGMLIAFGALFAAAAASANTTDIIEPQHASGDASDGFQAGPCTADAPLCTPTTSGQFFKTAGGHPPIGFVQFIIKHSVSEPHEIEPLIEPIRGRIPRTVKVDLPPGLSVNPEATAEKCTLAEFNHVDGAGNPAPECKPGTQIGESQLNLVTGEAGFLGNPKGKIFFPGVGNIGFPLYNLEPRFGEPALFGFVAPGLPVLLEPGFSWESDFHESFTIRGLPDFKSLDIFGLTEVPLAIHTARLITFGNAGDGTFATLPTTCFDPAQAPFAHLYSSWIRIDSFEEPDPFFPTLSRKVEGALPPGVHPEGCESIPFDPSFEFLPRTLGADSPSSPLVRTKLPVEAPGRGGGPIATSHLRSAEVTLPAGMGLNPAGSAGLRACTDAQFGKGNRELFGFNECERGSIIGTAEIVSPALSQPLTGRVYLGEPRSTDPTSGEEFRIFVEAQAFERGVLVRLIGHVKADPRTGQLTAIFDEQEVSPLFGALPHGLPQLPLESFTLNFDQARPLFTTPPTCSPSTTNARFEPWARPGTQVSSPSTFTLESVPAGGRCPTTLAERSFTPVLTGGPDSAQAGSFSPFRLRLVRPPGQQEPKRLELKLPKGLIGKLAGIPYCPEAQIAAAPGHSGAAEQRSPSCSAASAVGTTSTAAGSGESPLQLPGKVYLAGPYKGAPISLVAITPALSGPFDLGTVVIRVALAIDPQNAQITASSDLIPDVFGGVKLSLRAIELNLDRNQFTLNPTSCAAQAVGGAVNGGGADPANPQAFSANLVSIPFQLSGCDALGFQPQLVTTLSGPTKRAKFPRLTATLTARPGDANVSSVSLTLPRAFLVAQQHLANVCTRPQLASHSCPASSVYGQAEASSPLLDQKLSGPVYLVPGGNPLPDLVVDLHGQVDVQLHGVVSTSHGGIKTVFDGTPDVPLREFVLSMAGGKKSLIVNSTNVCQAKKRTALLAITAHNGKQVTNSKYRLKITGCKKRKPHKPHKRHHRRRRR
jgi:hypothetical protein